MLNKSKRMAGITATLPIGILEKIDELVEKDRIPSRSHLIREAVKEYIEQLERINP